MLTLMMFRLQVTLNRYTDELKTTAFNSNVGENNK